MIVDHPGGLHERVQDRTAAELESAGDQLFAHGIGNWAGGWNLGQGLPVILDGLPLGEAPQIGIQRTELPLDLENVVGIVNDGVDFGFVADDARVGEQFLNFYLVVAGHHANLEMIERQTEILALAQDGIPAQSSLHPIQGQEFEQHAVVMQRLSPLLVMIAGQQGIIEIPFTAGD